MGRARRRAEEVIMIFNVPGHIQYIRNGLTSWPADNLNLLIELRIVKTQTRRPKRGIYQVEAERKKPHKIGYAIQRKRGIKAKSGIRIIFDRIWEETPQYWCGSYYGFCISQGDARAEGNYSPKAYEELFYKLNPKWDGWSRWAFKFHVVEVKRK